MSGYRPSDEFLEMKLREARAEQPSVEALVERVRDGLRNPSDINLHYALAALDTLTAALKREREASQIHEEAAVTERAYRNAAEARAQKAELLAEQRATYAHEQAARMGKAAAVVEVAREMSCHRAFLVSHHWNILDAALAALDEQEQA